MLFNSFNFLVYFLPFTLILFYGVGRFSGKGARAVVAVMSFVFYAYWDIRFLPLLLASITVNYGLGTRISTLTQQGLASRARAACTAGVVFNLALLGFFKYANFFVAAIDPLLQGPVDWPHIALPIGISFFTFTQIAFLVDAHEGKVREYDYVDYALFVSYYPHQIAGPILHHHEMMGQFRRMTRTHWQTRDFEVGLAILGLGLAKKVLCADPLADLADPVFGAAEQSGAIQFFEAWLAALAYALQLYFDFSAYSDMAIGISLMFGIRLPINFDSPYKATSIIDFWQRWHITLSRFLRDYLYIALGGNRKGRARRYVNLLMTMALGGLWHGASWNFLVWGVLHGAYLVVNHAWRAVVGGPRDAAAARATRSSPISRTAAWLLTFVAVLIAWVFFRAATLHGAFRLLAVMAGADGVAVPAAFADLFRTSCCVLPRADWLGSFPPARGGLLLLVLMLVCLFAPNLQQLFAAQRPALVERAARSAGTPFAWRPATGWAGLVALATGIALSRLGNDSQFIYFNF